MTGSIPVNGFDGESLGVFAGDIDIETITSLVKNTKLGENGYEVLIDREGRIVAHFDTDLIGSEISILELADLLSKNESDSFEYSYKGII